MPLFNILFVTRGYVGGCRCVDLEEREKEIERELVRECEENNRKEKKR